MTQTPGVWTNFSRQNCNDGGMAMIRQATMEDWQGIAELMVALQNIHAAHYPDIFKKDARRNREYFEKTLASEHKRVFVAEIDGQIVGYIKGKIIREEESEIRFGRTYGYMDSIYVDEAYRGKLIDQKLFATLFAWFRENGIDYAEGGVWEFNTGARAVFELMGSRTYQRKQRLQINKPRGL